MQLLALTILIFQYITSCLCFTQTGYIIRDLESTTQAEFSQETMAWEDSGLNTGNPYDTQCGSMYLMAGYGTDLNDAPFMRTFENLPTHQSLAIYAEGYYIDAESTFGPLFEIGASDTGTFLADDLSSVTTNYCGTSAVDVGVIFLQTVAHTDSTFTFAIQLDHDGQGIRNLKILIFEDDISPATTTDFPMGCAIADPPESAMFACYCPLGKYYDGSSCQDCDEACEYCFGAGANSCYNCKDGYDFNGGVCYVCDEACDTCYGPDADTCYTCVDGYYFDGTSSCLQCNGDCETCSGAGSSACLTCPWGDPADASNQCTYVCDDACDICSGPYPNMCSVCNDGYYFDGTSSCLQCNGACETCSGSGSSACLTCPWGDPADTNNECNLVCDDACDTCTGPYPNMCSVCNDSYYFDGTSSCLCCDSSCQTCSGAGSTACLTCPSGDPVDSNSQCITTPPSASPDPSSEFPATESTKRITETKATTQTIVGAGLIAKTLVNAGDSAAIRFSMLAKMIQYIKYLDIDYPNDVKYALSHWDDDFINFNSDNIDITPSTLQDYESSYDHLPSPFTMYDKKIDSSFIMSFWEQLIPIFVIFALLITMIILEVIVSKNVFGETPKKITRQIRILVQGILIVYFYNDFADVFFFAILSYRTTKQATALSVMNILISILFIIVVIGVLIGQTWFVKKYQSLKSNKDQKEELEKLKGKIKDVNVLWRDFKDDSFIQMNALVFIVLHNIIFCLILALLFAHPLAQVILINFLSLAIMGYLVWFRPFEEKLELIETIICEGILFAVNICLLILLSLDSDSKSREHVGEAILVLTMIFNFVPLGFLVVIAVILIKKTYLATKAYLLKRKLDSLKKPTVNIKKSQVAPSMVISVEDGVGTTTKFVGNPETTQTYSVLLGKKESVGTNLLYTDTPNKTINFLSPTPTPGPIFEFEPPSDLDDQFLKVEDNTEDSPSKFSRNSLVGSRQQLRMRSSRENWMKQKYNEPEPENVFE